MKRVVLTLPDADHDFLSLYCARKGIRGGVRDLLSIATHSYVARNKVRRLVPPWEREEPEGQR